MLGNGSAALGVKAELQSSAREKSQAPEAEKEFLFVILLFFLLLFFLSPIRSNPGQERVKIKQKIKNRSHLMCILIGLLGLVSQSPQQPFSAYFRKDLPQLYAILLLRQWIFFQ